MYIILPIEILLLEASLVTEIDIIFKCNKLLFKGTSRGRDGLKIQHKLDVSWGEGLVVAKDVLYAITMVVNL